MRRRDLLQIIVCATAIAPQTIAAQTAAKTYRIGTLTVGPPIPPTRKAPERCSSRAWLSAGTNWERTSPMPRRCTHDFPPNLGPLNGGPLSLQARRDHKHKSGLYTLTFTNSATPLMRFVSAHFGAETERCRASCQLKTSLQASQQLRRHFVVA